MRFRRRSSWPELAEETHDPTRLLFQRLVDPGTGDPMGLRVQSDAARGDVLGILIGDPAAALPLVADASLAMSGTDDHRFWLMVGSRALSDDLASRLVEAIEALSLDTGQIVLEVWDADAFDDRLPSVLRSLTDVGFDIAWPLDEFDLTGFAHLVDITVRQASLDLSSLERFGPMALGMLGTLQDFADDLGVELLLRELPPAISPEQVGALGCTLVVDPADPVPRPIEQLLDD